MAALALACLLLAPAAGHAATYRDNTYGACNYSKGCAATPPPTEVTLPSGLVVTINVSDGQVIPLSGYTVIVQPADGQTGKLKNVDFYIDGVLQFSAPPNELGAARWLWLPTQEADSIKMRIVITADDDSTITKDFTVSVKKDSSVPTTPISPTLVQNSGQPGDVFNTIAQTVLGFVSSLPAPFLYGLPYILLALLLLVIVLLLRQTQREIAEVATLRRIIGLERQAGVEKSAFVTLASHYLRTPISIIEGGVDLLEGAQKMSQQVATQAKQLVDGTRLKIETLLARCDAASQIAGVHETDEPLPNPWKNPGLYVPIVLVGLLVFIFDYIVWHVESFSVGELNIIVQIVLFTLLAVALYQIFRRQQLSRRDKTGMQRALAHVQATNENRDDLISESATMLAGDLEQLKTLIANLPDAQETRYIKDGIARFNHVVTKFAIAGQLRHGQAATPYVPTSLSGLVANLPRALADRLAAKNISLKQGEDSAFSVPEPKLVLYVLASLVNNAQEYSQPQSAVAIEATSHAQDVAISVTDHGAGIPHQKMAMLFQPFTQTQEAERYTHEGMGFSLYLDKLILHYLGGTISVESKPGVKTVVTIRLPKIAPISQPLQPQP